MTRIFLPAVFTALLLSSSLAWAESACSFGVEPEMSGFPLNPIIDRLTVASAKPSALDKSCSLMVGDQIVEINSHVIPGARALKVREYFKQIKGGETYTLKVKRGDKFVLFSTK